MHTFQEGTMKHLQWGLLAAGNIAGRFARGLSSTDEATAVAVASRSLDKAQAFAKEHSIERAYGSYEELLADPDVDAVYISTPNDSHALWSIRCAEAGKHILCEKPVTLNEAELVAVVDAVRKSDVFFMEAFMYRCHPQWKRLLELLAVGTIGEVRLLESSFSFNMGYQPLNIRNSYAMGGGGLMDVGVYCVSFSRLIAGEEPVDCKAVGSISPEFGVDELAAGVLRFPSGICAHFPCGTRCGVPSQAVIFGTEGSISVASPWFPDDSSAKLIVNKGSGTEVIDITYGRDLYANEALTVAEHLDARQAPRPAMSWDDSLGQVRTIDALRASMGLVWECEKGQ